jgi:hypothetical protein
VCAQAGILAGPSPLAQSLPAAGAARAAAMRKLDAPTRRGSRVSRGWPGRNWANRPARPTRPGLAGDSGRGQERGLSVYGTSPRATGADHPGGGILGAIKETRACPHMGIVSSASYT